LVREPFARQIEEIPMPRFRVSMTDTMTSEQAIYDVIGHDTQNAIYNVLRRIAEVNDLPFAGIDMILMTYAGNGYVFVARDLTPGLNGPLFLYGQVYTLFFDGPPPCSERADKIPYFDYTN
jgi:hypothetical protein